MIILLPLLFASGAVFTQVFEETHACSLSIYAVHKIEYKPDTTIFAGGHLESAFMVNANTTGDRIYSNSWSSGMQCHNASNRLRDFALTPDGGMVGLVFINESCVPDETLVVKVDSNGDEEWRHEFGKGVHLGGGATYAQDSVIHVYSSHTIGSSQRGLTYFKYDLHGNVLDSNIQNVTYRITLWDNKIEIEDDSLLITIIENNEYMVIKADFRFQGYRELTPKFEFISTFTANKDTIFLSALQTQSIGSNIYTYDRLTNKLSSGKTRPQNSNGYGQMSKFGNYLVQGIWTGQHGKDSVKVYDLELNERWREVLPFKLPYSSSFHAVNDSTLIMHTTDSAFFYKFNPDSLPEIEDTEDDTGTFVNRISGKDVDLRIYPNPAGNFIHVEHFTNANYEIHNLTGQIVKRGKINQTRIEINALPAGSYFLRVTPNDSNQPPQTVTFIKN